MSNVVGGPINNQNPFCRFVCLFVCWLVGRSVCLFVCVFVCPRNDNNYMLWPTVPAASHLLNALGQHLVESKIETIAAHIIQPNTSELHVVWTVPKSP